MSKGLIDDADARFSHGNVTSNKYASKTKHWKYPQSVGNDTEVDDINFNSHESSQYAIQRMTAISESTSEPFMLFEFMEIDQKLLDAKNAKVQKTMTGWTDTSFSSTVGAIVDGVRTVAAGVAILPGMLVASTFGVVQSPLQAAKGAYGDVQGWIEKSLKPAERNYTGSIALYMPTDIQINDTMIYNEDTRKLGAQIEGLANNSTDAFNLTVLTDPAVLAAAGAGLGAIPFVPGGAAIGAVLAGSIGAIAQTEVQRSLGQVMNPNELVRYQQTGLRTFTFSWTILPDNEYESDQAAGLIKFFRKSAHARKQNVTLVTVPDHVITSFHGAKDMIQLPPTFIESVNVTYNPNTSSFFKRNNAPVEIGLSVSLKEIVPIYQDDVERGL
tara:strand:+ start:49 stop:1203 length:1155 start_codon:yes stop_codon:yes gene_type:complete